MQRLIPQITRKTYQGIIKPVFFRLDPERVHIGATALGERLGRHKNLKKLISSQFKIKNPALRQKILGINFLSPISLAAGFDYEARLTQITPSLGFGFQTVGTITNSAYGGNPRPQLGRLPQSKSLMVNKGFRNLGAEETSEKLKKLSFEIPIGVSVGRTNSAKLNQKQSIDDIICTFKIFEKKHVKNGYYELNISCPNLFGNVTFYTHKNLNDLLSEIDKIKLKKPLFIKMPITKTDAQTLRLLEAAAKHNIKGVIFGNLQSNRFHPSLIKSEAKKFKAGNFSGKPTFERSNELIELAYKKYKERFIIIGCGGVFSAEDAYLKIKKGATLVQLITGMVFEGPQLIHEINSGLLKLLKKDGFKNISEAIGTDQNDAP